MKPITNHLCPRCRGNNISNDICVVCGAYISPADVRVLVRRGEEPGERSGLHCSAAEERREELSARLIAALARDDMMKKDPALMEYRRAQMRAYYHRMKNDPAYVERRRAWYARMKNDPAYVERKRARNRDYYAKMKNDPAYVERQRQYGREYRHRKKLEKEAAHVAGA